MSVVGVTFTNADGARRQRIVNRCRPGERLELRREPNNRHDPDAIAVLRMNGDQIGYLPGGDERRAGDLDAGHEVSAEVVGVTGRQSFWERLRGEERLNLGLVIDVTVA